jgi:hypothetical protein
MKQETLRRFQGPTHPRLLPHLDDPDPVQCPMAPLPHAIEIPVDNVFTALNCSRTTESYKSAARISNLRFSVLFLLQQC